MKALITNAQNLIAKIDSALDYFWVGVVLYRIKRMLSTRYYKRAAEVQDSYILYYAKVPTEKLAKLRHQAKRYALEAQLIKEMFV